MRRRIAASVIVFAVSVGIGNLIADRGSTEETPIPSSTLAATTTTQPQAVFVSPRETVLGPAVLIADDPYVSGTQLVVEFDLVKLAPTGDAAVVLRQLGFGNQIEVLAEDLDTVFVENWSLVVGDDRIAGAASNPAARAARFEVEEGFDPAAIDEIAVESYSVLTPLSTDLALGIGNESEVVAPGLTARLLAITEQAKTIVQIELTSDRGFNLDNLRVSGIGTGWLSSVREAEGRPRWNLTHESGSAPDPILIRVEGASWIAIDQAVPVILGEDR